jgi:hypothetical protein
MSGGDGMDSLLECLVPGGAWVPTPKYMLSGMWALAFVRS